MAHADQTRRGFLQATLAGATGTAAYVATGPRASAAAPKPEPIQNAPALADVFNGIALTDQYGKPFNPAELYSDKPCIIVFGYGGCPMCEQITGSVAATQQKLENNGKHVPIIVISVQPENDRIRMDEYVSRYYTKGVKQYSAEELPLDISARMKMGEKSYAENRDRPQSERLLNVVNPPTAEDAMELERRLGLIHNPNRPQVHSFFMVACDKGRATHKQRAIDDNLEAPPAFAQEVANNIAGIVGVRAAGQGR